MFCEGFPQASKTAGDAEVPDLGGASRPSGEGRQHPTPTPPHSHTPIPTPPPPHPHTHTHTPHPPQQLQHGAKPRRTALFASGTPLHTIASKSNCWASAHTSAPVPMEGVGCCPVLGTPKTLVLDVAGRCYKNPRKYA